MSWVRDVYNGHNPCPCGYFGDPFHKCSCTPPQIQRYMSRISGPLMDRIDIHIEVPAVKYDELAKGPKGESSNSIRTRVLKARDVQVKRFNSDFNSTSPPSPLRNGEGRKTNVNSLQNKIYCNAHMSGELLNKYCSIDEAGDKLLKTATDKLGLSARAYDRIRKVARTIADLEGEEKIQTHHLSEAIQYRSLDRQLWLGGM